MLQHQLEGYRHRMIYDKTRANELGYYENFELCYKPALEKDRKDAERYRWLRRDQRDFWIIKRPQDATEAELNRAFDEAIDKLRTTEPLLVAPPVTKGKAESHIDHPLRHFDRTCQACISQLNQVVDDYDLTSNDTRRGD